MQQRTTPPPARWNFAGQFGGLALGGFGAVVFLRLGLPLPFLLGALTVCMIAAIAHVPFAPPNALQIPARIVLGVAVGTAFTPALLGRAPAMAVSLALMVPWVLAIIVAGSWFLRRAAGLDRHSALYAVVPGGLSDMIAMAEDSGANVRAVTLIQLTRIVLIVFALPFWLVWHDGFDVAGRAMSGRLGIGDAALTDLAVLTALGVAGWLAARRLGVTGAAIVGPMVLSAIVHLAGLSAAQMPLEAMIAAQITLGALLGAQFRGLTRDEFRTTMVWGIASAVLLLAVTALLAAALSRLLGVATLPVLLAFAPGGQSELNLLAYTLDLDPAYVALHHLVRLAVCMAGVQWALRRIKRRETLDGGKSE